MPQSQDLFSQMYLKIGGDNASEEIMDSLMSIEVDDNLLLLDMFSIQLRDPNFKWTDSANLEPGKAMEISVKGENGTSKLLTGEITALEPQFSRVAGPTVVIRGYDQAHRLHRAKQTRTFVQETDSDIVKKIARECGLRANVDNTREVYEYVSQDNQTDMEFLQDRAQRIGYRMYVEDDTLYFRQALDTEPQVPALEWGINLLEFEARLTTTQQVTEVNVRGWDPKTKKEIIGQAKTPQDTPQVGERYSGGELAKRAFNIESKEIVVNRPVATQTEADALAQSICDEMGNDFIKAEGLCLGEPAVHAGAIVELKGIGQRFSGRYRITRAIHRYEDSGYTTHFEISGRRANTLGALLTTRSQNKHGVVVGIVTNNSDPDGLGRVKVKLPTMPGNEESHWARLVTPMAGDGRGIEFIPEVNDEVLVAFEHDDSHRPFVLGALWNGKDKPPEPSDTLLSSTGKVEKRIIRSRSGHTIILDDTDGKEKISIVDKTGKNSIEIDSANNLVAIKAQGDILLEASGNVKIKGSDVELEASGKVKTKGMDVQLEASASATLKGGSGVSVEASGTVDVKGARVNLN